MLVSYYLFIYDITHLFSGGNYMQLPVTEYTTPTGLKKQMTARDIEWLGYYFETRNASKACRMMGITNNIAERGRQLKAKLSTSIQSNLQAMIGSCAPDALESIYELAKTCPDPRTKLAASQDLLNRAGYKEALKVDVNINDMSDKDIDKQINDLLGKGNVVVVDAEIIGD